MYACCGKRFLDFIGALVLIVLLSPILCITSLCVYLSLGAPIFFRQQRPGFQTKPFRIWKFRTMSNARDEQGELLPDAMRLYGAGKWIRRMSLDELPQLFNVLAGDMSFVGPRPLLMEYLPLYSARQALRHHVRPGITGLAQINGRNAISWQEKLEYDARYVETISFWLDMKILMTTCMKVIKSDGVNKEGMATTDKFTGNEA